MELRKEDQDPAKIGIYNLRSGGHTAAEALSVSDRFFQRHGGCRSEKPLTNYVKESLDSLLFVTKTIYH